MFRFGTFSASLLLLLIRAGWQVQTLQKPLAQLCREFRGSSLGSKTDPEQLKSETGRVFEQFDTDMSGDVSIAEFEQGLKQLGITTSEQEVLSMFEIFDVDQSGTLSKVLFLTAHTTLAASQMWQCRVSSMMRC